ncbi:MAG: methyl-accepting chemotaxis protein [Solidesulfovibrio sp.]
MKNLSINVILNFAVLASLLAGISVLVIFVTNSSNRMTKNLESHNLLQTAGIIQKSVDLYIRDANAGLKVLSELSEVNDAFTGDSDPAKKTFRSFLKGYDNFFSVFILDTTGKPLVGANKVGDKFAASYADRDYFKAIMSGKDSFISNIMQSKGSTNYIFVAARALKDSSGKLLGLIAISTFWNPITEQFIDPLRFGERGYAFMVDNGGQVIAHGLDKSLILKPDATIPDFMKKALQTKEGLMEFEYEGEPAILAVGTLPSTGWKVCVVASIEEMTAKAAEQRNILLIIGVIVLMAVGSIITFISRKLVLKPVMALRAFSERIAAGDFKAQLSSDFRYELGQLADNIRGMVSELKNKLGFSEGVLKGIPHPCSIVGPDFNMRWINQQVMDLMENKQPIESQIGLRSGQFYHDDATKQTLADETIKERRSKSAQIEFTNRSGKLHHLAVDSTPFFDMDGELLGSIVFWTDLTDIILQQHKLEERNTIIAQAAARLQDVAEVATTASEELSAQIEQSSRGAEQQSRRIAETATAMEEMNSTVMEVTKNASQAAQSSETARQKAQEGERTVSEVIGGIENVQKRALVLKQDMSNLGHQAEGIGAVMNVISDIADQTNLLALNAAIEAARAGEAGRGFAVVADEVRKLAEKTMTATKEVGEAIRGIQEGTRKNMENVDHTVTDIDHSTALVKKSGETLGEIVHLVEVATDQVRSIATASEQQSATSEEINRSLEDVSTISAETAEAMTQSAQAVSELANQTLELKELIEKMQSGDSGRGYPQGRIAIK